MTDDDDGWSVIATASIDCTECCISLPIPIMGRLRPTAAGTEVAVKPDLTELWAHSWARHPKETNA